MLSKTDLDQLQQVIKTVVREEIESESKKSKSQISLLKLTLESSVKDLSGNVKDLEIGVKKLEKNISKQISNVDKKLYQAQGDIARILSALDRRQTIVEDRIENLEETIN